MHTEHHQLLEEVTRLKQQLRSGGVVGAVDLGGRGDDSEVTSINHQLRDSSPSHMQPTAGSA